MKFYFSFNSVNTRSDKPSVNANYQYAVENGPGAVSTQQSTHFTNNDHKQGLGGDKGEDRVDLRPLRDFLATVR